MNEDQKTINDETITHIYNHYDNNGARINVKVVKNTKGYTWEVTVTGASSIQEALGLTEEAERILRETYGEVEP